MRYFIITGIITGVVTTLVLSIPMVILSILVLHLLLQRKRAKTAKETMMEGGAAFLPAPHGPTGFPTALETPSQKNNAQSNKSLQDLKLSRNKAYSPSKSIVRDGCSGELRPSRSCVPCPKESSSELDNYELTYNQAYGGIQLEGNEFAALDYDHLNASLEGTEYDYVTP